LPCAVVQQPQRISQERLIVQRGAPRGELAHQDRSGAGAGGACHCLDSLAAAAAEADNADICTLLQINLQVRQFSPPGAANSQFWLCSGTHKLSPRATMFPKPEGCSIIIANSILQG
jgi:hypothetical protein